MLFAKIKQLIDYFTGERERLLTEIVDLKSQLAESIGNDAADAEAIAAAQKAAADAQASLEAVQAKNSEMQNAIDADAEEDAQILSLLDAAMPAESEASD
jgi:hypothetical protein